VERGLAAPSIAALQRIARALQVPPGQLWDSGPRRRFVCVTTREEAPVLPAYDTGNAGEVRVLMAEDQPLHVLEASGLQEQFAERPMVNSGDVVVYVVEGQVEVDLDGTTYALGPGSALQFSGLIPSNIRAAAASPTRILYVRSDPPAS
jgi:Cupin domain